MKQNERNEKDLARKVDELVDEKKNIERQEAALKAKLAEQKTEIDRLLKIEKELKETELGYIKREKESAEKEKVKKKKEIKKQVKKKPKKAVCGC